MSIPARFTFVTLGAGDVATLRGFYERLGWQRVGVIPNYALMPDGAMAATTYYYKHL